MRLPPRALLPLVLILASCGGPATSPPASPSTSAPAPSATVAIASPTATAVPKTTTPGKTSDPITVVGCGTLIANTVTSGQGSGPNTWELLSPTGVQAGRFSWDAGQSALGTYICARLIPGAPMSGFSALIRPGDPGYVPQPTLVATDSCGSVTGYAADGAHMLVTLTAGGTATQYDLQFQFASGFSPTDIGTRLQASTPQLLLITGAQVAPDSGSPNAVSIRRYNVARVSGCTSVNAVNARPTGFVLAPGCAYIDQPIVGTDQSSWLIDCGWPSNDARGTLAYPLTQQGWTGCGVGLGNAYWAKGTARLIVSEGAGGPGGYPKLTQPARPASTTTCP